MTMKIAAFDPVQAFEETLMDLVRVVEIFEADNSAMTPMEFLQATRTVGDRLRSISLMSMTGVMRPVSHKIPQEVRDQFESQVELDQLMTTPEEEYAKMVKVLRDIATFRDPGDGFSSPGGYTVL